MATNSNQAYFCTSSFELQNPKSIFNWEQMPSDSFSGSASSVSRRNSSQSSVESLDTSDNIDMMKLIPDLWSDKHLDGLSPVSSGVNLRDPSFGTDTNINTSPFSAMSKRSPFTSPSSSSVWGNSSSTPSLTSYSYPSSPKSKTSITALAEPFPLNKGSNNNNNNNNTKIKANINCRPSKASLSPSTIISSYKSGSGSLRTRLSSKPVKASYPLTEENLTLLGQQSPAEHSVKNVCESKNSHSEYESRRGSGSRGRNSMRHSRESSRRRDSGSSSGNHLYKTEMCVQFQRYGYCPYGSKCQFAHGPQELKKVKRCDNWKTKPCINWLRTGTCRYGKRCCFKHGDEDNGSQLVNEPPPAAIMDKISMKLTKKGYFRP